MTTLSRRSFLATAAAAAGAVGCGGTPARELRDDPFGLGVASGDPSADGVVLWTRLLPPEGAKSIDVEWVVAEDEAFTKGVRRGRNVAPPELAHSVHVELEGLQPDRPYWYRFRVGAAESEVGRTRTLPAPGAMPSKLRMGIASCQSVEQGLFTAYEHMLKEDLELVIHLGDYIYEGAGSKTAVLAHQGLECKTLEGYRQRYAQYKAVPALRAMHAAAPWLVTPDDHEFDNNCAGSISEEKKVGPEEFLRRRAAAYQAYYENMPLRRSSMPAGPDMKLYRRFAWGRLADLYVLDTRQYRTDQPCGDGNKAPCPEVLDPNGTILGAAQRDWLLEGLSAGNTSWNILAQQVMVAKVDRKPGDGVAVSMDQWPGYEAERRRLLKHLHDRKLANAVVLAGDIHTNWANELVADFDGLDGKTIATEFVGTSISSGGDGQKTPKDLELIYKDNPFVKFHNAERGYLRCEVDAKAWRTDYRTVPFVRKPGAPLNTRASFVVEAGQPGLKPA